MRDSLWSFASSIDTEAVLQESLLRVWQVAPRFVPDGKPNGLLRLGIRIARNLAVSEVRRTRATLAGQDEIELAEVQPELADPLLRRAIVQCHDALPDKPKQVLAARVACEGTRGDDQLAESLGMRLNTFLQNFTRARRALAECPRKKGVQLDEVLEA